jgi:hypothetical protein
MKIKALRNITTRDLNGNIIKLELGEVREVDDSVGSALGSDVKILEQSKAEEKKKAIQSAPKDKQIKGVKNK